MTGYVGWETIALVCCLLLAGCSAFTGSTADSGDGTLTPAPVPTDTAVPTTDTPTGTSARNPTASGGSLPPGITRNGIENVSRIAEAHRAVVAGRSYVRVTKLETRSTVEGATMVVRRENRTVAASTDVFRHDSRAVRQRPGTANVTRVNRSLYVDGLRAIERTATSTGTRYERVTLAYRARVLDDPSRKIERYLVAAPATVTTVERNGSEYVRVVVGPGAQVPGTRDYAATVLVTRDGFVRSLRVHFHASGDPNLSWVTYHLRYEQVGNASGRSSDVGQSAVEPTGEEGTSTPG